MGRSWRRGGPGSAAGRHPGGDPVQPGVRREGGRALTVTWRRPSWPVVARWRLCLPGNRPASVMAQAEVPEAAQVEGADAHREAESVAFHAPVADPSVSVCHEPCDGALHHRPPLPVDLDELAGPPGTAGLGQLPIMFADREAPAGGGRGTARTKRAAPAA